MPTTEQVIVEFVPDFTALDNAFQKLSQSGTIDKATAQAFSETNKQIQQETQSVSELKKQFDDLKSSATKMGTGVEQAFQQGVTDALNEAGVSAEQFNDALTKSGQQSIKTTQSLKQELKALAASIAEAKAKGSPIDPATIKRAGQLKDAIADANQEIKNAGSDTRNIDNVIGSLGALAGGYAAVQGAAALFGDTNDELQKSLLKVNAAMAIAQGVQQVVNALQKEGALTKLADVAATGAQTVAQTAYNVVVGTSTGLLKGLRIAFAATGIGAFIFLVYELINALSTQNNELEDATNLLNKENSALKSNTALIKSNADFAAARAKQAGKTESEITKIRAKSTKDQINAINEQNLKLQDQKMIVESGSDAWNKLNDQMNQNNDELDRLTSESISQGIELEGQLADEKKDNAAKQLKSDEEAAKAKHDLMIQGLKDSVATLERQLLDEDMFAADRLELEKKLVDAKAKLEINSAKKTTAEIWLIEQQAATDRLALVRKFNQEESEALQADSLDGEKKKWANIKTITKKGNDDLQQEGLRRGKAQVERKEAKDKKDADDDKKRAEEKAKRQDEAFQQTAQAGLALIDLFAQFSQAQSEAAEQKIQRERDHVDELLQAGAITEKDAKERQRRLDAEDRKIKREQAKREKEMALFQAAINMALAISKASPDPFEIALAIAIGLAQIAVIASRPLPKFASGKKGSFKGLGIIGEAGSELLQRDGKLMLVTKPSAVYLRPEDKVYSHSESQRMLQNLDSSLYKYSAKGDPVFDYDRLGESIAKNSKRVSINIDKDFIAESVADGLSYKKYFNRRYSSR